MKVLNILTGGNIGGIEVLCKDIGLLAPYKNMFCFVTCEGLIYDQMKDLGLSVYSMAGGSKFSIRKLKKLKTLINDYDIIAVHHGDIYLNLYYYLLSKICREKKYVRVVHSCYEGGNRDYNHIKNFLSKTLMKVAIRRSDACIFVSKAGLNSHLKLYKKLPEKQSFVVYNGVGVDKIEKGKKNFPKRAELIRILYIGRLANVKGIPLLLDAVADIKNDYNVYLTIVGDGPEWESLHKQTEALNITDIVSFTGNQTDVIPFLEKGDIFVYPSVWEEVFGISIIEAMAFGLICIANRVGGIPEIIQDGVNGFLTKEQSRAGIADAIRKAIYLDKEKEESMRSAAKQTAERFSITNTVDRLTYVLEKVNSFSK